VIGRPYLKKLTGFFCLKEIHPGFRVVGFIAVRNNTFLLKSSYFFGVSGKMRTAFPAVRPFVTPCWDLPDEKG